MVKEPVHPSASDRLVPAAAIASAQRVHSATGEQCQEKQAKRDSIPDKDIHRPGAEIAQEEVDGQVAADSRGKDANPQGGKPRALKTMPQEIPKLE